MPQAKHKPNKITVRSYQVGFGDCFLLSISYENPRERERHVLIDCGSTSMPKRKHRASLTDVAKNIRDRTKDSGGLDVVVATHRHKDHISGFSGQSGKIIADLKPSLVLQPWTEDPLTDPKAKRSTHRYRRQQAFRDRLDDMHAFAAVAKRASENETTGYAKGVRNELFFQGFDNLSNEAAVENLRTMGKNRYLSCGDSPGTTRILPGVKVWVLGPPSIDQYDKVIQERSKDEDEFWHLQAGAGHKDFRMGKPLFPEHQVEATRRMPLEARWFVPGLEALRGEQLLSIVRQMDNAMNNTSLILLFEIGRRRLLFPGDAQIENWEYILHEAPERNAIRQKLRRVDFYKVGHHGSLNATPRTLWGEFTKKSEEERAPDRLRTLVSTKANVHGSAHRRTEVPRKKLIHELKTKSNFKSTQEIKSKQFWDDINLEP